MDVKLNNFVEINLVKHNYLTTSGSRDTVVLLNFKALSSDTGGNIRETTGWFEDNKVFDREDFNTLKANVENTSLEATNNEKALFKYFENFFNNGGLKIKLLHINKQVGNASRGLPDTLKLIGMKEIVIMAFGLNDYNSATTPNEKTLLDALTGTGIHQKIFIGRIDPSVTLANYTIVDKEFYAKKYGKEGIEGAVCAYLSQIKLDNIDTAKDYCFVREEVTDETNNIVGNEVIELIMRDTNPMHFNADCLLVGTKRNIGGNDCSGYSLTNQFMLICLYQTLTERLVNVLAERIKYDSIGIGKIMTAIALEINKYIRNGYVSLDKVWNDTDLILPGSTTTVIKQGEKLIDGYRALLGKYTNEDLVNHKFPPIYLLIADQYAIRKVNISGEVF